MKIKILHISIFLLGLIILCAPTCEDPGRDAEDEYVKDEISQTDKENVLQIRDEIMYSIREEFKTEHLTDINREAFEERAKEKIIDFADYLSIYSTKAYDTLFRQQARQMMVNLFINHDALITISMSGQDILKANTLETLIHDIYTNEFNLVELKIINPEIYELLHTEETAKYVGKIKFSHELLGISSDDTLLLDSGTNQIDIITVKINKTFGNDSIRIWEVLLGDMR